MTYTLLHYAVGLIGYEQTLYTVDEGAGTVEFCVSIFEPNVTLIDPIVAVSFFVETVDGMAIGMNNISMALGSVIQSTP